jgi:hypothetical protein
MCGGGSYGWNNNFTKYAGTVATQTNGTVPYLIDISDPNNPHGASVVPTSSGSSFNAGTTYAAQQAVVDPAGNVWWLEFTNSNDSNVKVYEGTRLVATTDRGYLPGPMTLEFRGSRWEIQFGQGDSYFVPGVHSFLAKDPLAGPPATISSNQLQHILPKTNMGLSDGYYSTDRSKIYFLGSGPSGSTLYSVAASGGEPTSLVQNVGNETYVTIADVLTQAAYCLPGKRLRQCWRADRQVTTTASLRGIYLLFLTRVKG